MGALKSALTAIFNANNYTSSTSGIASKKIPVNESNGLPSGQIGMSDLASVLGAFPPEPSTKTTLRNLPFGIIGVYDCSDYSDSPDGMGHSSAIFIKKKAGNNIVELIIGTEYSARCIYTRFNNLSWVMIVNA